PSLPGHAAGGVPARPSVTALACVTAAEGSMVIVTSTWPSESLSEVRWRSRQRPQSVCARVITSEMFCGVSGTGLAGFTTGGTGTACFSTGGSGGGSTLGGAGAGGGSTGTTAAGGGGSGTGCTTVGLPNHISQ